MRVNEVKALQAGGYITYQPLPAAPQAQQPVQAQEDSGSSKAKDEDQALNKELIGKLLGEGLTNDVMQYSDQVNGAYQQYSRMTDLEKNTYRGRQLRMVMKGDLGQLNALVRSKKNLEDATKQAHDNNSIDELAVTPKGLVVRDGQGKIQTISFAQYAADNNNKDKQFQALTNGELIQAREYDNQLVNDDKVPSIVSFGQGLDKVKDEVYKVISTIASNSSSVSKGGYGDDQNIDDMNALQVAASNGIFRDKSGETHVNNAEQIAKAKRNLWISLKDNSKAVLRARAATMVTDPADIEKTAMTIAASLLDPHEYHNDKIVVDERFQKGAKGAKGEADAAKPFGPTEMAFNGRSNHDQLATIGPDGVKLDGHIFAVPNFNYTNDKNERTTLQNAGKLDQISSVDKAFTANGDPVNKNNTVVTGSAYYTTLPVVMGDKGVMQIDQEGAKKWAQVQEALSKLPVSERTPLKESELKVKYGANSLNLRKLVVAEAASYADSYFDSRDPKYYEKITDSATKKYVGDIVDPDQKTVRSWLDNSVYKHLIFMPAKDEASARFADGHEATLPGSTFDARQFNTGANGANISDGQTMGASVNPSTTPYSTDFWK